MTSISPYRTLTILITLVVIVNGALWFSVRDTRTQWINVPPAQSPISASFSGLGDRQYAYRVMALFIQNLGDTGGRTTSLKDYNYEELGKWFMLGHSFDPVSNILPALAGYVFGANQDTSALGPIIDYLEEAGSIREPQKWRWWVQAIFLARHKMQDYDRALDIATKLANRDEEGLPAFTKQMHAFILNRQMGEKEAALALMINLIKEEGENLHPNEVNAINAYICEQILSPEEAKTHDLCAKNR